MDHPVQVLGTARLLGRHRLRDPHPLSRRLWPHGDGKRSDHLLLSAEYCRARRRSRAEARPERAAPRPGLRHRDPGESSPLPGFPRRRSVDRGLLPRAEIDRHGSGPELPVRLACLRDASPVSAGTRLRLRPPIDRGAGDHRGGQPDRLDSGPRRLRCVDAHLGLLDHHRRTHGGSEPRSTLLVLAPLLARGNKRRSALRALGHGRSCLAVHLGR